MARIENPRITGRGDIGDCTVMRPYPACYGHCGASSLRPWGRRTSWIAGWSKMRGATTEWAGGDCHWSSGCTPCGKGEHTRVDRSPTHPPKPLGP